MSSTKPPIVIDNGSYSIKSGFAKEEEPYSVIPTMLGQTKEANRLEVLDRAAPYIGEEADGKKCELDITYPVKNSVITDFHSMEEIWSYIFGTKLQVKPEEHAVLLTEGPFNPIANREKTTQVIFETFDSPAMYLALAPVLALYASGRKSGVTLDSGHGSTNSVPIHEGFAVVKNILRVDLGGEYLTDYLKTSLVEKDDSLAGVSREVVRDIKESLCYVSLDFEKAISTATSSPKLDKSYTLPDGRVITIGGAECIRCPESLFHPSSAKTGLTGIHELVYSSVLQCDEGIQQELLANIVLAGGNTMFEGISQRIQEEVACLAPSTIKTKVIAAPVRKYSAWIGGSILASLPQFQSMWITKKDYEEAGPAIVQRKCV